MSYFSPYINETGIHMPTYEDRLDYLVDAYRSIFGVDSELSASVPDYQLLSVFAKALDDVSALIVQAYNSRNPAYATGEALDLLLPQYGLTRETGETDASLRARIRTSLAGRGAASADALLAAVLAAKNVKDARLYINDTDSTDSIGMPAHSIQVVIRGGAAAAVAQAIYDKKAPGITVVGTSGGNAVDSQGNTVRIPFTRHTDVFIFVYLFIKVLPGGDQTAIEDAVVPRLLSYIDGLGLATPLNIPQLYGVAYAANPAIAQTFVITDIQVAIPGAQSVIRDLVPCEWNQKVSVTADHGVTITFST